MDDNERNRLLNGMGNQVNTSDKGVLPGTASHTGAYGNEGGSKKKWIIGGIAGLAILGLILGLTLGGKGGGDDGGGGDNPPDVFNPYVVDGGSIVSDLSVMTGKLKIN